MNSEVKIPEWMVQKEEYVPQKDHDRFITKTTLSLMGVLSNIKSTKSIGASRVNAFVRIAVAIYLILLSALSRNMFFNYCLIAGLLIRFCLMKGVALRRSFLAGLVAAMASGLIMIPAVIMGNPQILLRMACKVFFSAGLLACIAETTPWNELTAGLRFYHVPDVFVFTFDITLKYIVLLGEISLNILTSLRLRSVGKNAKKSKAMSGVLGVTFMKSRQMADEMYEAMVCRGFEGEYRSVYKHPMTVFDWLEIGMAVVVTAIFVYINISGIH